MLHPPHICSIHTGIRQLVPFYSVFLCLIRLGGLYHRRKKKLSVHTTFSHTGDRWIMEMGCYVHTQYAQKRFTECRMAMFEWPRVIFFFALLCTQIINYMYAGRTQHINVVQFFIHKKLSHSMYYYESSCGRWTLSMMRRFLFIVSTTGAMRLSA